MLRAPLARALATAGLLAVASGCTEYGFSHPIPVAEVSDTASDPGAGDRDGEGGEAFNPEATTSDLEYADTGSPAPVYVDTGTPPADEEPPAEEGEDKCYDPESGYDSNPAAIIKTGDSVTPITITFVGFDSAYQNDLYLDSPASQFLEHAWQATPGHATTVGPYSNGTEVAFGIYVNNTGDYFRSGPGSRNPDGQAHVAVTYEGGCSWLIGFEDLYGGGDRDFNDTMLRVQGNLWQM